MEGSNPMVTGSNSAIAPTGPRPGRTPTRVPITAPMIAAAKLMGENAISSP